MVRPNSNELLDALSATDRQAIVEAGRVTDWGAVGEPIGRRGEPIGHVIFPFDAVFSAVIELDAGKAQVALIGRDGFIGVHALLHASVHPWSVFVLLPGHGLQLSLSRANKLLAARPLLRRAMTAYAGVVLARLGRSIACNSFHSLRQRMGRWLLALHDRSSSDEFALTHETLAVMLAASRPHVSVAAAALRDAGLIEYGRGRVRLLDRPGLQAASCDCDAFEWRLRG